VRVRSGRLGPDGRPGLGRAPEDDGRDGSGPTGSGTVASPTGGPWTTALMIRHGSSSFLYPVLGLQPECQVALFRLGTV
jgi:hypothetical protein